MLPHEEPKALVCVTDVYGCRAVVALRDLGLGKRFLPVYCPRTRRKLSRIHHKVEANDIFHRDNIDPTADKHFVGYSR